MKKIGPHRYVVFFDFDNTIARGDVFDEMLLSFAKNNHWMQLEEKWKQGKIGSKECLSGQLRCINMSRQALDSFLSQVKLDPYFRKLIALFAAKKIKAVVLSDNFDYLLRRILKTNGVSRLRVFCNKARFVKKSLIPSFPFENKECRICAHCKTKNLLANVHKNSITIYIGDGRSDACPARYADIVFAKEDLLRYCQSEKIAHLAYKELRQVYNYFRRGLL